ncbi:Chalcone and stilbene synthases domain protein [Chitinispirillum alkaliphilum]|nr:Chalcone and stilbene synthases domain protein [Chitinispirillum alkaliphilum]
MAHRLKKQKSPHLWIKGLGSSVPPSVLKQQSASEMIEEYFKDQLTPRSIDVIRKVFSHESVRTRRVALDEGMEWRDLKNEDPDRRAERFLKWAVYLGCDAAEKAMKKAGVKPADVRALAVNTCTGYVCPGLSTYISQELGLSGDVMAFDLVGSGCGGAIPVLQCAGNALGSFDDGVALAISVEICTATFQMGNDISLIVSNALFGDGAGAAVIGSQSPGLGVLSWSSFYEQKFREEIRFTYKNGQLHNKLTPQLPKIIGEVVPPFVTEFLSSNELAPGDIAFWAIHPGGDRVITELQKALGLSERDVAPARTVLKNLGNMSSPTVWFELEDYIKGSPCKNDKIMMLAFGAGLSAHTVLLENQM